MLSDREKEVMLNYCKGVKPKAIGRLLEISEHTVKVHMQNAKGKLGAGTMIEAAILFDRVARAN